jgi:hypothetical protein
MIEAAKKNRKASYKLYFKNDEDIFERLKSY